MWQLFLALGIPLTNAAYVNVTTNGDHAATPYYTNIKASTTTELLVRIRGQWTSGFIELTPTKLNSVINEPIYEIGVGGSAFIRPIGLGDSNTPRYADVASGGSYIPSKTGPGEWFWLSWKDPQKIAFGKGNVIGNQAIFDATKADIRAINYVGFLSNNVPKFINWAWYDVEVWPLKDVGCTSQPNLPRVEPTSEERDYINDVDTNTCMVVPSTSAGKFLTMDVYHEPPLKVRLTLRDIPSCEESNLVMFSSSLNECPLTSSTTSSGVSQCVYSCTETCNYRVVLGFTKARFEPQTWKICEIAEMRNLNGIITSCC